MQYQSSNNIGGGAIEQRRPLGRPLPRCNRYRVATVNATPMNDGGRLGGRFLGASAFDFVLRGVVLITVVMLQPSVVVSETVVSRQPFFVRVRRRPKNTGPRKSFFGTTPPLRGPPSQGGPRLTASLSWKSKIKSTGPF